MGYTRIQKQFKCRDTHCGMEFSSYHQRQYHEEKKHRDSPGRAWVCQVQECSSLGFWDQQGLSVHVYRQHNLTHAQRNLMVEQSRNQVLASHQNSDDPLHVAVDTSNGEVQEPSPDEVAQWVMEQHSPPPAVTNSLPVITCRFCGWEGYADRHEEHECPPFDPLEAMRLLLYDFDQLKAKAELAMEALEVLDQTSKERDELQSRLDKVRKSLENEP
jgi:hypothetical protein